MKILITGGGGFVGSNLVRSLESKSTDFEIIVIDDFSFGFKKNLENTKAKPKTKTKVRILFMVKHILHLKFY